MKFKDCLCTKINYLNNSSWVPVFVARITLAAIVFVEAGWGKLHNIPKIVSFFTELGIPFPQIQAPFVAGVEFVCGLLLLVGLWARLASIPVAITMIVAILTAKRDDLLSSWTGLFGMSEFDYIIFCLLILFMGAGPLSLDRLFCRNKKA